MTSMYISCNTLTEWFNGFTEDETDWFINDVVERLYQGLADTNMLLVDNSNEDEQEKLRNINSSIIIALRDLKSLQKEVGQIIANGEVLTLKKAKEGGSK